MEYLNLEKYISIEKFDSLQDEIHTALAERKDLAISGTWSRQLVDNRVTSKPVGFKLISEAMTEFMALPDDHPVKKVGIDLYRNNFNSFGTYLKNIFQAYDPYNYYKVHGRIREFDQPLLESMPNVLDWLKVDLKVTVPIFQHLEKVTFIVCDPNGIPWDHKDLDCMSEFIYVRMNLEKPSYLWDPIKKTKFYINSRAAYWNPNYWFGEEQIPVQTVSIKIEGIFTEYFRNEIKNAQDLMYRQSQ